MPHPLLIRANRLLDGQGGVIDGDAVLCVGGRIEAVGRQADETGMARMSHAEIALRAAYLAQEFLRAGFTALRDMGAPGGTIIVLRRAIDADHRAWCWRSDELNRLIPLTQGARTVKVQDMVKEI